MSHTKEPWKARKSCGVYVVTDSDKHIAIISRISDAERIVACVNACAGMDDPAKVIAAKDTRIAELEAALKVARTVLADTRDDWKVIAGEESIIWIRVDNAEKQARAALERGER